MTPKKCSSKRKRTLKSDLEHEIFWSSSDSEEMSPKMLRSSPSVSDNKKWSSLENNVVANKHLIENSPHVVGNEDLIEKIISEELVLSPVIGSLRSIFERSKSPTFQSKNIRELKLKFQQKLKTVKDTSPDLFESADIDFSDSDLTPKKVEQCASISQYSSPTETKTQVCISQLHTQESSEVEITVSESSGATSNLSPVLYYEAPVKKQKYSKNGLASKINRALHIQKTNIAIWKHEISKGMSCSTENIKLEVEHLCREFGIFILECRFIDASSEFIKEVFILNHDKNIDFKAINKNECIILGNELEEKVKIKSKLILFPPYSIKVMDYKNSLLYCIINASKIITL